MNRCDAIVIGAGHNGLTSAAYLARAGLKVTVLERRPADLPKHGLRIIPYEHTTLLSPDDGNHLGLYGDHDLAKRSIARHSPRDAEAYGRFSRDVYCQFPGPSPPRREGAERGSIAPLPLGGRGWGWGAGANADLKSSCTGHRCQVL